LYGHQHDQDGEQEISPGRKDHVLLAQNPSQFLPQPIAPSRDSPPGRHREMGRVPPDVHELPDRTKVFGRMIFFQLEAPSCDLG
jgi:hypothetical protein